MNESVKTINKKDPSLLILGLALCLGLLSSVFLFDGHKFYPDSYWHLTVARNLVEGQGFTTFAGRPHLWHPPFYPLVISFFYLFIKDILLAGSIVSILCFLVSIIMIFKISKLFFGSLAACFTVLAFALHERVIDLSGYMLSHNTDIFLNLVVLYFGALLINAQRHKFRLSILFGTFLSFAVLNRPENILSAFFLLVVLFLYIDETLKNKCKLFSVLLLTSFLVLVPYVHFTYKHTGKVTLTSKLTCLEYYSYLSSSDPNARAKKRMLSPKEFEVGSYIKSNARELISRYVRGLRSFFMRLYQNIGSAWLGVLILIGLFWQRWSPERRKTNMLLCAALSPLAILPLGVMYPRYFLFSLPVFLLWSGYGFSKLAAFFLPKLNRRHFLLLFTCIAVILAPYDYFIEAKQRNITAGALEPYYQRTKQVCLWMKANIADVSQSVFLAREPIYYAFYVDFKLAEEIPRNCDVGTIIRMVNALKVDYLLLRRNDFSGFADVAALASRIMARQPGFSLEPIYSKTFPEGPQPDQIILYRVKFINQ